MSTYANGDFSLNQKQNGKQCRSWWDGLLRAVSSGSTLFVLVLVLVCQAERFNASAVLRKNIYEGCSKWIAYFYLETSNFKLAQKYSFHALEVLPVARNAKFQPMCPLLEGVTVRWFGHSNKVLMNGRSKCLSGLVFPPSKECFQFQKQKEITWG